MSELYPESKQNLCMKIWKLPTNKKNLLKETICFFINIKNNNFSPTIVYDNSKKHPEALFYFFL